MEELSALREEIYEQFQASESCQRYFFQDQREDQYAAYYTSMYLLQDTLESLMVHRKSGFSTDPMKAYIEFWGIMQAIIIQQDAAKELHFAVTGRSYSLDKDSAWMQLRYLRNECAGHPAKANQPRNMPMRRSFMSRNFGGYKEIWYEQWNSSGSLDHPRVKLGELIDSYSTEVSECLKAVLDEMRSRWP